MIRKTAVTSQSPQKGAAQESGRGCRPPCAQTEACPGAACTALERVSLAGSLTEFRDRFRHTPKVVHGWETWPPCGHFPISAPHPPLPCPPGGPETTSPHRLPAYHCGSVFHVLLLSGLIIRQNSSPGRYICQETDCCSK